MLPEPVASERFVIAIVGLTDAEVAGRRKPDVQRLLETVNAGPMVTLVLYDNLNPETAVRRDTIGGHDVIIVAVKGTKEKQPTLQRIMTLAHDKAGDAVGLQVNVALSDGGTFVHGRDIGASAAINAGASGLLRVLAAYIKPGGKVHIRVPPYGQAVYSGGTYYQQMLVDFPGFKRSGVSVKKTTTPLVMPRSPEPGDAVDARNSFVDAAAASVGNPAKGHHFMM